MISSFEVDILIIGAGRTGLINLEQDKKSS